MINRIRTWVAVCMLVLAALPLALLQLIALKSAHPARGKIPVLFHRLAARALGLKVRLHGAPSAQLPIFLVANHVSWLDIVALGSVMPLSFIAKAEVADWPVFGLLARLQRTVFVEREARRKAGEQAGAIARRLAAGDAMVLFAEGTTSDGNYVYPFNTSLFGAAQGAIREAGATQVTVQPVAIAYVRLHGMPMGRVLRPVAAWPGDIDLMPHLSNVLANPAIDVDVSFGEPIVFDAAANRKAVAREVERTIRRMASASLRGRTPAVFKAGQTG